MAEISFTIDLSQDLTIVIATGKIACQEIKCTISRYSKEKQTDKVLWNFIQADASKITPDEFRSIHQHSLSLFTKKTNRKIAVVVGRTVGFGIARMSETYGEIINPSNNYRTFYNVPEALNWLGTNQAPNDGHSQ